MLRLTVDGETFEVHLRADGSCHFDWISGPNKGYGFSSSGNRSAPPTEAELREDIRAFLAQIDPSTGYID